MNSKIFSLELVLTLTTFCVISTIPTVFGWVNWNYQLDDTVVSIGVSSDGNFTVAGTESGTIFLFDRNGGLLWQHHFTVNVESVAISGDGSRIAVALHEYRISYADIYLFNNQGNIIWQKDIAEGSWPFDVAISPDASYIVAGDTADKVYFCDISGNLIWNYQAGDWITTVSTSSDGEYTAAGSNDDSLYFFDKSGNLLWSKNFGINVYSVSVSPEGGYVGAESPSGSLGLFDTNGNLVLETPFYITVDAVSLSENANRIAVVDYRSVTVIDKTENTIYKKDTENEATDIAITADGKFVTFGYEDYVYFLETLPSTTITCEISSTEIAFDESITASGYISPSPQTGTQVTITYTRSDESNLTRIATTNQQGYYSDIFTPDTIGTWSVKAQWFGNEINAGSESESKSFTVGKTEINCEVSPKMILIGGSVTASGSITPPISGSSILLEYTLYYQDSTYNWEGFVTVTHTATTLSDGSFTDLFIPSEEGRWRVNASWTGDLEHMSCESQIDFAVNPPIETNLISENPVTLYWDREQWNCLDHYFLDTAMPTSSQPETVAFDPDDYWWIGHGHWPFKGAHTAPLSKSITIKEGVWNLSIWAAAREPNQHFVVGIYYWNQNHDPILIESWDVGYFDSSNPDVPTQFQHSFPLPAQTITEGSCLGFIISECRDSDIKWFFDSISYPSSLTIPASTIYLMPPVASFTVSPLYPEINDVITFDASECIDHDGTIVDYSWDFGDGITGAGMTPTHTYTTVGTYTVTLTVTDDQGLTDLCTYTFTDVIPELSTSIMLISLITTTLAIIVYKKRK